MNANSSTTIADWLRSAEQQLKAAHIGTPRLDSLVLLSDELGHDKAWLLSHPEHILKRSELKNLSTKIIQRAQHIPLAYLRGHVEFYGRKFMVNKDVLVPRPESEAIIELLKSITRRDKITIVDVGTGSGALAITAKLEVPNAIVIASDVDHKCLKVTRQNAANLHVDISCVQSDLLDLVDPAYIRSSILLANLPYVPDNYVVNDAAQNEPMLALFGGTDGLDFYRRLFASLRSSESKPAAVITEALAMQHASLVKMATESDFTLQKTIGLAQLFVH